MVELEIHSINVSQGDSTLIVNRNIDKLGENIDAAILLDAGLGVKPAKKEDWLPFAILTKISLARTVRMSMLIDAGDDVYGQDVASYLAQQGVDGSSDFYTLATHYHADHVGGFFAVFYKDFDVKKALDTQTTNLLPVVAYDCGDLVQWDDSGTRRTYKAYIDDLARRGPTVARVLDINSTYNLGKDKNDTWINLKVVASNGTVSLNGATTTTQVIEPNKTADQNARSVTLVLEYGDFRCFLGGDIGGTGEETGGNFLKNKDTRIKKFFSSHPNIETSVTTVLPLVIKKDPHRLNTADGHVCVHSANHHGSATSNDVFFVEAMLPRIVFCSAGIRRSFHAHPTQEFFQRIDSTGGYSPDWQEQGNDTVANPTIPNTVDGYYVTEMAQDGTYGNGKSAKEYERTLPKGKILGDIVVRPISEVDPARFGAAGKITIQVYGTGLLTDATWSDIPLRAAEGATNAPLYPIGPFVHDCNKH
jgi:beta-lactamase superfamily II metal-dependent hydrolase